MVDFLTKDQRKELAIGGTKAAVGIADGVSDMILNAASTGDWSAVYKIGGDGIEDARNRQELIAMLRDERVARDEAARQKIKTAIRAAAVVTKEIGLKVLLGAVTAALA